MAAVNRGFASSMLSIFASIMLLELLFYIQSFEMKSGPEYEKLFAAIYAGYYHDDITYDIESLVPNNPRLKRINGTYVEITFTDIPTSFNMLAALGNYTQKLEAVERKLGMNATIDYSNLTANHYVLYFSNGMIYDASYDSPYQTVLQTSDSMTMRNYTVNYSNPNMSATSINYFNLHPNGNPNAVFVQVNYADANNTFHQEGYDNYVQANVFQANYDNGGQFMCHIQKVETEPASFRIIKSGIDGAYVFVDAIFENNDTSEIYATIPINVIVTHFNCTKSGFIRPVSV